MDYLDAWHTDASGSRTGDVVFPASDLLRLISPFKRGVALTARKLASDIQKKPFFVVKEHTRKGECYTIAFQNGKS